MVIVMVEVWCDRGVGRVCSGADGPWADGLLFDIYYFMYISMYY